MLDALSILLIVTGACFFLAGTVGLLRFPDVYLRVHALTKADNVGLGFVVLGLMLQAESGFAAGKLLLIWVLALLTGATLGQLVARAAHRSGIAPWRKR